jgi:hypothetical protein
LIESGDIVYWKRPNNTAGHIGMFAIVDTGLYNVRRLVFVNSAGDKHDCDRNKSNNGGPVIKDFEYAKGRLSESSYGIVRINVANAWTLRLRCRGRSYDAFSTELSISETEDLDEQITANFNDYDGKPLSYTFQLQYDKDTKILNLQMVSSQRVDAVQIKLDKDNTGYVDMQRIISSATVCLAQVCLTKGNQPSAFKSKQLTEATKEREEAATIYFESK